MKNTNDTPINYETSTSKATLNIHANMQRERSNSFSEGSSRRPSAWAGLRIATMLSRRGSHVNLPTSAAQDSMGSNVSLAEQNINFQQNVNYIGKHDLEKLYDYIGEITKEDHWMHIDEIIQKLQNNPKDISATLIDHFSNQKWDTRSDDGHSFLTIAIQRNEKDNINYLLGYMKEERILHDSAKQGELDPLKIIISFLENQGRLEDKINTKDEYGKTPLHYAAESYQFQLLTSQIRHITNLLNDVRGEIYYK